jgi:hypothetical protein
VTCGFELVERTYSAFDVKGMRTAQAENWPALSSACKPSLTLFLEDTFPQLSGGCRAKTVSLSFDLPH